MDEVLTDIPQDVFARELSPGEKALRDKFVDQYLIDFSPVSAALRIGFKMPYAAEMSSRFMEESYVRNKIVQLQAKAAENPEVEDEETKRNIRIGLIKEAHYTGPGSSHAARVTALKTLATLYGMEAPKKSEVEVKHRGGVMAVPGIADPDAWEDAALDSQQKLVSDVRH